MNATNISLPLNTDTKWPFEKVPVYDDGTCSCNIAMENWGAANENTSWVLGIADTTANAFAAYLDKVRFAGFSTIQRANWQGVISYQCYKEDVSFYIYFTPSSHTVRIIVDNSKSVPLERFNYSYHAEEDEYNELYMFGLETSTWTGSTGHFFFLKLADNSLFVIDGGNADQPDIDEFLRIARKATGTPQNQKIRIACWFISHGHNDHTGGVDQILRTYSEQLILERIMYNFNKCGSPLNTCPLFRYDDIFPDVLYHVPRTGETIQFGNLTADVLYTHEDLLDIHEMEYTSKSHNDSCTVLKLSFDGIHFMLSGDISKNAGAIIMNNCTTEQLKSDIFQIPHHGANNMPDFYECVDAKIALIPTTPSKCRNNVLETVESTCDEWYSSDETVGIRAENGEAKVFCRFPGIFKYNKQQS